MHKKHLTYNKRIKRYGDHLDDVHLGLKELKTSVMVSPRELFFSLGSELGVDQGLVAISGRVPRALALGSVVPWSNVKQWIE